MERIVIEVEDATAKKWRFSTQEAKNKIAQQINITIAKELMADSKKEFAQFLDEIRNTMEERGLTEEMLNDILKDEN